MGRGACPSVTSSTWTGLRSNPDLRGENNAQTLNKIRRASLLRRLSTQCWLFVVTGTRNTDCVAQGSPFIGRRADSAQSPHAFCPRPADTCGLSMGRVSLGIRDGSCAVRMTNTSRGHMEGQPRQIPYTHTRISWIHHHFMTA